MAPRFNGLRQFFIAETSPALIIFLNAVFTTYYWGGGLLVIGMSMFLFVVGGLGALIINLYTKGQRTKVRMVKTALFALILAIGFQVRQLYDSRPSKLKGAVLSSELSEKFNCTKARIFYPAFEVEIYTELEANSSLVNQFLQSRRFFEVKDEKNSSYGVSLLDSPLDWFPKKGDPGFRLYIYNNNATEEYYVAFISEDEQHIYASYLAY